ncbi:MAG: hypothetical protein M3397_02720 [Actinomycetota bacterium]|nr:hypothetical protein [Actinomycetota bacterium]
MAFDLTRALVAALVVGVAPGWFWAAVLAPTSDRAERLCYSVALSLALVPAVALFPARLFGLGMSLPLTVISVLAVFVAGLLAYVRFGTVKGEGESLATGPADLGLPVLIPLSVGLLVLLGVVMDVLPATMTAPLICLIFVSAGVAHLLDSRRRDDPEPEASETEETGASRDFTAAWHVALAVVLGLVTLRGYLGPARFDWPYIRGVDQYEHAVMTDMTVSTGTTGSFMLYPPGFHYLTAAIHNLSGLEPLEIFPVLAPALPVLPALGCYALGRRLWGQPCGVAAAGFAGLLISGPYMHFAEARYPNLITAHFTVAVTVAALMALFATPSVRSGLLLALLGSSVVLYHQVGSFYEAVLLAFVALIFLPYLLLRERRTGITMLASFALLGFLSVLFAWETYDLPSMVGGVLGGSGTGRGGDAVSMAIGTQPPLSLGHFLSITSQPALWFGLLGALLLLAGGGAGARPSRSLAYSLARTTLLVWTVLLFIGSRTALSGFPERFERDLGIPLSVLAGFAFVAVLGSLWPRGRLLPATMLAAAVTAMLAMVCVGIKAGENLKDGAGPDTRIPKALSTRSSQVMTTPEVVEAGRWLEDHNTGGNIVASPYLGLAPSRAMLAMGDYDGIQSYDGPRIKAARDLPPSGAGPLWDALWLLRHPDGERTRRLMQEKDIRYVVLYKGLPPAYGVDPRAFRSRPDIYRTAFENEQVVIFEPENPGQ